MKSKVLIILILILIICSISIGFAASVTELSISGLNVSYRPNAEIRITDVSVVESNGFTNYSVDYNSRNLFLDLEFSSDTSYVIYDVDVTNFGNIDMGLLELDNQESSLNYEFLNYDFGSKICDDDSCNLGASKTLKLKISPKVGNAGRYSLQLNFIFRNFVTITYYNISGFTNEEVICGAMVDRTLPGDVTNISINNGVGIETNYTYQNNLLHINEVSSNLFIYKLNE